MPKPDAEVVKHFRNPSHSRRFARRLRAGIARPAWMTEAPEELARKHECAAAYVLKIREVGRLAAAYKRVQSQITNGAYADAAHFFQRMNETLRNPGEPHFSGTERVASQGRDVSSAGPRDSATDAARGFDGVG